MTTTLRLERKDFLVCMCTHLVFHGFLDDMETLPALVKVVLLGALVEQQGAVHLDVCTTHKHTSAQTLRIVQSNMGVFFSLKQNEFP